MTGETEPTIGQQVATKALTKMAEGPRFADGSGWPGSFPILAKFIDDAIVTALAESRAETERVREALDGAREALEVARRDHRLADAGLVSNRQQYLREREKHAETVMRLEEVDNDLDTARAEVSRLTERLGRAEGRIRDAVVLSDSFAECTDSDQELDVINRLSDWAEDARDALASAPAETPAVPKETT